MSKPIFLLKTKSSPHDGYEEYFQKRRIGGKQAWQPIFVPVLEHKLIEKSLDDIKDMIRAQAFSAAMHTADNAAAAYGGLIFTSQRAVEAFSETIRYFRNTSPSVLTQFKDTTVYVVGPATARGLRSLELEWQILGEDCGNGEALADYMLEHYNKRLEKSQQRPPLHFLVGEQHRDIIPRKLRSGLPNDSGEPALQTTVQVQEIATYETGVMENFATQFDELVRPNLKRQQQQWVVVFSPTGCKAMLEVLGLLDQNSGTFQSSVEGDENPKKRRTRIATIGPTTRDHLINEFGFEPDAVAQRPSPEGLGAAIEEYESAS